MINVIPLLLSLFFLSGFYPGECFLFDNQHFCIPHNAPAGNYTFYYNITVEVPVREKHYYYPVVFENKTYIKYLSDVIKNLLYEKLNLTRIIYEKDKVIQNQSLLINELNYTIQNQSELINELIKEIEFWKNASIEITVEKDEKKDLLNLLIGLFLGIGITALAIFSYKYYRLIKYGRH